LTARGAELAANRASHVKAGSKQQGVEKRNGGVGVLERLRGERASGTDIPKEIHTTSHCVKESIIDFFDSRE